jgi:hypothetical protein
LFIFLHFPATLIQGQNQKQKNDSIVFHPKKCVVIVEFSFNSLFSKNTGWNEVIIHLFESS